MTGHAEVTRRERGKSGVRAEILGSPRDIGTADVGHMKEVT